MSARAPGAAALAAGAFLTVGALLTTGVVAMLLHASAERARANAPDAQRARAAVVRLTGSPDLALSSASRWLRHPSLSEPGAAFADAPALPDVDPAGAAIAPPRTLLRTTTGGVVTVRVQGAARR
jgi:hypothetical protein